MTDTRSRVQGAIERHPGVHFRRLVRMLSITPGQVQYHIRRLRRDGSVIVEAMYGQTHYYPPGFEAWERRAMALIRRETSGDIVAYVLTNGSSRPSEIADDLDIARSTLSWHLDRLVAEHIVTKTDEGAAGLKLTLTRPMATARILREIDPALWELLIGRYTRLVDRLLE